MSTTGKVLATVAVALIASAPAWAQPIVYPAGGQDAARQQTDEGECHVWAKQSTGIDPATIARQPPPSSASSAGGGERVRGAARGALGGAAIGAIAGDTGEGAAIGAVAGTMLGGRRARQNAAAQNEAAASGAQAQIDTYYRAYGACLEGRGYTIK